MLRSMQFMIIPILQTYDSPVEFKCWKHLMALTYTVVILRGNTPCTLNNYEARHLIFIFFESLLNFIAQSNYMYM